MMIMHFKLLDLDQFEWCLASLNPYIFNPIQVICSAIAKQSGVSAPAFYSDFFISRIKGNSNFLSWTLDFVLFRILSRFNLKVLIW